MRDGEYDRLHHRLLQSGNASHPPARLIQRHSLPRSRARTSPTAVGGDPLRMRISPLSLPTASVSDARGVYLRWES